MAGNEDLARLLPDPPPARPAGREAAIAAAMRRFDGVPEPTAPPPPARPRLPEWLRMRPAQAGVFASILLVGAIALPIALRNPGGPIATEQQTDGPSAPPATPGPTPAATPTAREAPPAATSFPTPAAERPAADKPTRKAADQFVPPPPPPEPAAPPPPPVEAAPAPEPPSAKTADAARRAPAEITVTGARRAQAMQDTPVAITAVGSEGLDDSDSVVVTGVRRSRRIDPGSRRGDWNACTVDDPDQSLDGCKRLVNPAARGPSGVAEARVADGLAAAWRGDWNGAAAAFDKAIALQPRLAFAYLNRGLIRQRQGDLDGAAADFDAAIRHAPSAARGYFARSRLRREQGDERGARNDGARALHLDRRYEVVVE